MSRVLLRWWSVRCVHCNPGSCWCDVQVTVVVAFLVLLVVGVWGLAQVKDGLDLTDVVPRDTTEYNFLEAQAKYFGFYSVYAITQVMLPCYTCLTAV